MKIKYIAAASLLVLVGACSTGSSDYRAASRQGSEGYFVQGLETDRYRVEYRLNDDNVGRAQDLALLRAAELTMERGYKTFEVVSRSSDVVEDRRPDTQVEVRRDYVVTRNCGLLGCSTSTSPSYTTSTFGTYRSNDETIVAIEIKMSNGSTGGNAQAYDASEIAANIRSRL